MVNIRKAFMMVCIICICINADTIVNIDGSFATGTWSKDKSPYTVIGNGNVQDLEIQAGVRVIWKTGRISLFKGFFRLLGTEQDSIIMTPADTSLMTISLAQSDETFVFEAKYARFSALIFNCTDYRNTGKLLLEHCSFIGGSRVSGQINILDIYKTGFQNTIGSALDVSNLKDCRIACCTFSQCNELRFSQAEKMIIDSCFITKSKERAIKLAFNKRAFIKNSIITDCVGYQGAAIGLDCGNEYTVISNNIITHNIAATIGGALAAFSDNDTLLCIGNIIAYNTATNGGGGAFLQARSILLLNNNFSHNSDGISVSCFPLTAINNVIGHNGTKVDSIQIRFDNDTMCAKSGFYNCCIEFGVERFALGKYYDKNANDTAIIPFSGTASSVLSIFPDMQSYTIPNSFGYFESLPVFPTSSSTTINHGLFHAYLTTISPSDILGNSWTKDDSVDIGPIQFIRNNVFVGKSARAIGSLQYPRNSFYDFLGRAVKKNLFTTPVIDGKNRIILKSAHVVTGTNDAGR